MVERLSSGDILSVEQLSANFRVFAGPGAGKTHFLVENIKNIVERHPTIVNSRSRKVACITYTNAAVEEIKRRLEDYVDSVEISTIHGFIIENIIKPFQHSLITIIQQDFGIIVPPGAPISSQIEGLGILHGVDKTELFDYIRASTGGTGGELDYSKYKMGQVEVDNDAFVTSVLAGLPINPKLLNPDKIIPEHVKPIKSYIWSNVRKLTHNEILYFGYRILQEDPTALYYIRVRFPFIFVDEFQDTNPVQTLLVKLIGKSSTHIGVVGDIAQSIYSFQGAKPNDFKNFEINHETDRTFAIQDNRRSTKNIVNFCNFLRQSDDTVVQNSIKIYGENENSTIIESKKIHFLLGDTPTVRTLLESVVSEGGVILTRVWAAAFDYIRNISAEQAKLLKSIYNSYYNSPIQIRDEIVEHNNVPWVRAFRFIFDLHNSFFTGSLIDLIKAIKLYVKVDEKQLCPKALFQYDKLANSVFSRITDQTLTCDVIKQFNEELKKDAYLEFRNWIEKSSPFDIQIFDDQERDSLIRSVSQLQWDTSYKLFSEVFSANSKYMTVHQAKGLEWKKVVVSALPTKRRDGITLSEVFESPQLIQENSADEFVRIYYVACSRAIEDLYIHITEKIDQSVIENSIAKFVDTTGQQIEYEIIT